MFRLKNNPGQTIKRNNLYHALIPSQKDTTPAELKLAYDQHAVLYHGDDQPSFPGRATALLFIKTAI
jgi:hypothetical protein